MPHDIRFIRCIICRKKKLTYLLKFYKGGEIVRCQNCTNAFTLGKPSIKYKQTEIFIHSEKSRKEVIAYTKPIIKFIRRYIRKGRMLDVGCGDGTILEMAKHYGFIVEGIEPSFKAVKYCLSKGLKVRQGFFERLKVGKNKYDIIVLSHVIEHVKNPNAFLAKAYKLLKKRGYLFLYQMNYEGTIPRILKSFWEGWVTSQHITHFSPEGMKYFLKKNNFLIKKIELTTADYRLMWRWGGVKVIANNFYYSFNYLLWRILKYFDYTGDQMLVMAQKM